MKHLKIKIRGGVQGVSFRYYTQEKAESLGICGFVRNEKDGSVYIEAEGEEAALEEFLTWCRKGPPAAWVENVEVKTGAAKNFSRFKIHI